MANFKTLRDIVIRPGTRVLLRTDFDVSVIRAKVTEDFRIRQAVPSIKHILRRGGRIRIIAHLKRPHGKIVPAMTLRPIALHLGKLLGERIVLVKNPFDPRNFTKYNFSPRLILFENIRFWPGEEENSVFFASRLARWGDCYVNDAFANSHRAHASMVSLARMLPSYAGLRLEEEVVALTKVLDRPRRPVAVILGGAKLETKLPLIEKFLSRGDEVCVGGAIANSILAKKGIAVGNSFVDRAMLHRVKLRMLRNSRLHIPADVRVSRTDGSVQIEPVNGISSGASVLDIGPKTEKAFLHTLGRAKTILWNGPLGLIETVAFAAGTINLARGIKKIRAFKVIGGGELISCLRKRQLLHGVGHVSTGGGAMLEFLSGKNLPAIKALGN